MQEAIDQAERVAWPPPSGHDFITVAQRQLAGAGAACSIPLVDGTRIVGAMTLERSPALHAAELALLADVARLAGPCSN
jgi:hypothetical protein